MALVDADEIWMFELHHNADFALHFFLSEEIHAFDDFDRVTEVAALPAGPPHHPIATFTQLLLQNILFHFNPNILSDYTLTNPINCTLI